ncbi:hypothetical protein ACLB2K_036046 [Fragaria x ananassa]
METRQQEEQISKWKKKLKMQDYFVVNPITFMYGNPYDNEKMLSGVQCTLVSFPAPLHGFVLVTSMKSNGPLRSPHFHGRSKMAVFDLGALKAPGPDGFSAFVNEKLIQDNIMVAHEVYHHLKLQKSDEEGAFGLKLDMNKAYDQVEWCFLEKVLQKLGFSESWVKLVMSCVTSVNYSIILNGKPGSWFTPSCGLRQGNPLSPFLFLFVNDVLSKMLLKTTASNLIRPRINTEKSSLYFSPNNPPYLIDLISSVLNMKVVDDPGRHLGLPTIWGQSKRKALCFVIEAISRKVAGWKQSILSQAGKEVLIKSVASAIPAYTMSCFKFPLSTYKEINSTLSDFWWGNSASKGVHWNAWESLGLPKAEGGRGFQNFQEFNDALLAKQVWRLHQFPNSISAQVIKQLYHPTTSILKAKKGGSPSWL